MKLISKASTSSTEMKSSIPCRFCPFSMRHVALRPYMASASGGVTVRIDYTFYRDIRVGEKLLFFGRGGKVRGKTPSRIMCWASGAAAAAIHGDGTLEPVVSTSGQWLGIPALTKQMREALIPAELNRLVFELAGG
jgi:hypothetical protein